MHFMVYTSCVLNIFNIINKLKWSYTFVWMLIHYSKVLRWYHIIQLMLYYTANIDFIQMLKLPVTYYNI